MSDQPELKPCPWGCKPKTNLPQGNLELFAKCKHTQWMPAEIWNQRAATQREAEMQSEINGLRAELDVRRHECRVQGSALTEIRARNASGEVPCPHCYGGHFRPCQTCGDTGWVKLESK